MSANNNTTTTTNTKSLSYETVIAECSEDFAKKINNLVISCTSFVTTIVTMASFRDSLVKFGQKTSHTLREDFDLLCAMDGLSGDAVMWLYLFACSARTKDRVLFGLNGLDAKLKGLEAVKQATTFAAKRFVSWVEQEKRGETFAVVHLPSTRPGLCMMLKAILDKEVTRASLLKCPWAPQINWAEEMHSEVEVHAREFWTKTVKTTTKGGRKARDKDSMFDKNIFETQLQDEYPLHYIDSDGKEAFWDEGRKISSASFDKWIAHMMFFSDNVETVVGCDTIPDKEAVEMLDWAADAQDDEPMAGTSSEPPAKKRQGRPAKESGPKKRKSNEGTVAGPQDQPGAVPGTAGPSQQQ